MKTFFLVLFITFVSMLEIKILYAKKKIREIYAFSILMLIATYLSVGQLLEINISNPINNLNIIFRPIQTWFFSFLS
ncbi:MAG: hypothetical protein AB7V16_04445 [Vulcanibacillus sp.]